MGLISKKPHPADKRKDLYELTEAGLDLIPVLLELSAWGAKYEPETAEAQAWLAAAPMERERLIEWIRDTVKQGKAVLAGGGFNDEGDNGS